MTMRSTLATFAAYGPLAGSARVRIHDWLRHLDLDADVHSYLGGSSLPMRALASRRTVEAEASLARAAVGALDRVLVSRRATPFGAGRREAQLLARARHGVYDFDDAVMLRGRGLRSGVLRDATRWRRSVEAADVVIAGNEMLAEAASALHGDVRTIPSCVEPDAYLPRRSQRSQHPRAVWIGSPSTEQYVHDIGPALLRAHRETGLRLTLISAGDADLGALHAMVDRVAWTPTSFARQLAAADLGIMPLRDTAWERGKCAYKVLQYAAAGLPSIASPVGANRRALDLGMGVAATSEREWTDALIDLSRSPSTVELGLVARLTVEQHYSFERWASDWRAAVLA